VINLFVSLAAVFAILLGQAATPSSSTYVFNMYDSRAVRYQNPDKTACTATVTMIMLNTIYYASSPTWTPGTSSAAADATYVWRPTVTYKAQEAILRWERGHMTMPLYKPGADVHGWRNALNYFGWGSVTAGAYADLSYTTFAQAAVATVRSIALTDMPVGILAWYGSHAQVVTGYSVTGEDPRTGSTNFKINGVYLTDSLVEHKHRNDYVTYQEWRSGPMDVRFMPYYQSEGIYKDPIDGKVGRREWWAKFVIVGPVLPQSGSSGQAPQTGGRV